MYNCIINEPRTLPFYLEIEGRMIKRFRFHGMNIHKTIRKIFQTPEEYELIVEKNGKLVKSKYKFVKKLHENQLFRCKEGLKDRPRMKTIEEIKESATKEEIEAQDEMIKYFI
jgi:hypothetical protein